MNHGNSCEEEMEFEQNPQTQAIGGILSFSFQVE